jgi:hypothetical protein
MSLFGYGKKRWMDNLVIEVNGVEYKCLEENDGVAEAVIMNPDRKEKVDLLGLRNFLEVNGKRYVLRRITPFCAGDMLCKYMVRAFGGCARDSLSLGIKPIQIPSSVEIIGEACFQGCESLYGVVFEWDSKLKEIGDAAFSNSGIRSIRIPNNVEHIEARCFYECNSLCEVVFETDSKLKKIGGAAFFGSKIKSIRIPSNVEILGK